MNHESDNAFEFLRHRAGIDLTPHQQAEFQRLTKILRFGSRFQFLFVEIADPALRDRLIERLTEALELAHEHSVRIDLSAGTTADVAALEQTLREESARGAKIIHVVNADLWLNEDRLQTLNLRREALAHTLNCRLAFWLPTALLERVASRAADLWSWRSGVYSLVDTEYDAGFSAPPQVRKIDWDQPPLNLAERAKRIVVLRQWLTQTDDDELQLPLIDELATLLADMGETDEAIDLRRNRELPIYRKLGDERSEAVTQGQIADILYVRGQLDEALDIVRSKQLPIYRKLGDNRSEAVTQGRIADILYVRGQLDDALDIRSNKELPVYRKLGDVRGEAIAQGRIARILYARGQFDEALDIRRNKQLPVYRKLGDVRGEAVTSVNIAKILHDRGQPNEALETLRKALAVFESSGYQSEATYTRSRIAAIEKELSEAQSAPDAPPNLSLIHI